MAKWFVLVLVIFIVVVATVVMYYSSSPKSIVSVQLQTRKERAEETIVPVPERPSVAAESVEASPPTATLARGARLVPSRQDEDGASAAAKLADNNFPAAVSFGCKCATDSAATMDLLSQYFDCVDSQQQRRCRIRIAVVGDSHIYGFNATERNFNGVFSRAVSERIRRGVERCNAAAAAAAAASSGVHVEVTVQTFARGRAGLTGIAPILYQLTETMQEAIRFKPHIVVFGFGTNEAPYRPFVGRPQLVNAYRHVLNSLFSETKMGEQHPKKKKRSFLAFVLSPPAVAENCRFPMYCMLVNRSLLQGEVMTALREFVNVQQKQIASGGDEVRTQFVDWNGFMFDRWSERDRTMSSSQWYQWDGMHLSQRGSIEMANFLRREVCTGSKRLK